MQTIKFQIQFIDDGELKRIPLSYLIRNYFEKFIEEEILDEFNIIKNSSWTHILSIMPTEDVFLEAKDIIDNSPGSRFIIKNGIQIFPESRFKNEKIKSNTVFFYWDQLEINYDVKTAIIEMFINLMKLYFETNYKKITSSKLDDILTRIDLNYLNSIPYPALFEDQKYSGDTNGKRVYVTKFEQ